MYGRKWNELTHNPWNLLENKGGNFMKIYAINGGPRKKWNTATMLEYFLQGAQSAGADVEVETIHLYDLKYTGCQSCVACKLKGGPSDGKCGYPDGLRAVLEKVSQADGIVCGSPICFHDITAQLRGFLEKLFFQDHPLVQGENSIAPKKIASAMIYTMNVKEERMREQGYPEIPYAFDTYEFKDYSEIYGKQVE